MPAACHVGFGQVPSAPLSGRVWLLGAPTHACAPWFQGYEGLVEGGDNIKPANWLSVSNIIQLVRPVQALRAWEHTCVCAQEIYRDTDTHTDVDTHTRHTQSSTLRSTEARLQADPVIWLPWDHGVVMALGHLHVGVPSVPAKGAGEDGHFGKGTAWPEWPLHPSAWPPSHYHPEPPSDQGLPLTY